MASSRSQAPSSRMVCSAPVLSQGPAPYSTETMGSGVQGAGPTLKSVPLCVHPAHDSCVSHASSTSVSAFLPPSPAIGSPPAGSLPSGPMPELQPRLSLNCGPFHCGLDHVGGRGWPHASLCPRPLLTVSIEDIQEVRMGHRTEGLEKFARDVPEDRCFSIVFKNQRNTLDLIASSPADAQHWVQGLRKIIHHSGSMDQQQKLQQYPFGGRGTRPSLGILVVVVPRSAWVWKIPSSDHHTNSSHSVKQHNKYLFSQFWRLEVRDQGASMVRALLLASGWMSSFSLCPHTAEREREREQVFWCLFL